MSLSGLLPALPKPFHPSSDGSNINRETRAMADDVRRLLGKAIHHYRLIEPGEHIAVAVSGGKDSLVLLWLLRERLRRVPVDYHLTALHLDPGFDPEPAARLEDFFRREGFPYRIVNTDSGLRAHSPENRENPCFLCARLRRAAMFREADRLGCRKVALGHNQDDLIETFFINICYGAQVSTMVPRQEFFGGKFCIIRPLALAPAAAIERLAVRLGLPAIANPCPSAGNSKRQQMRTWLQSLCADNRKVRGNIFHAMSHVNPDYLPPPLPPRGSRGSRRSKRRERGEQLHRTDHPSSATGADRSRTVTQPPGAGRATRSPSDRNQEADTCE